MSHVRSPYRPRAQTMTLILPEYDDTIALTLSQQTYRVYVREASKQQVTVETVLAELVRSLRPPVQEETSV